MTGSHPEWDVSLDSSVVLHDPRVCPLIKIPRPSPTALPTPGVPDRVRFKVDAYTLGPLGVSEPRPTLLKRRGSEGVTERPSVVPDGVGDDCRREDKDVLGVSPTVGVNAPSALEGSPAPRGLWWTYGMPPSGPRFT